MREYLTRKQLLAAVAVADGERLEAHPRTSYAGAAVEYLPRRDTVNNHPDCYPWHVVGRPDYARLRRTEVVVADNTPCV